MRALENKENKDKKRQRNQIVIGAILIGIMLLSTAGYAVLNGTTNNSDVSSFKYNKLTFTNVNGYWQTKLNGASYNFLYKPTDVNNLKPVLNPLLGYYSKPLYISSEDYNAEQEISMNFYNVASSMAEACLQGENCSDSSLPIKTCDDNFIIIKQGVDGIYQNKNCVIISGKPENLVKNTDAFLYKLLGVI